jgi:hypothetical protein
VSEGLVNDFCTALSQRSSTYCCGVEAGGVAGVLSVGGVGAGALSGGCRGRGVLSVAGIWSMMVERWRVCEDIYADPSEVSMKTAAAMAVRRDKKVAGPRLPNNVCDEPAPPNAALSDPPLPT